MTQNYSSTPVPGTVDEASGSGGFHFLVKTSADQAAGSAAKSLTLIRMAGQNYHFKKARLTIPNPKAKDPRWYITYEVWDKDKDALRRLREYWIDSIEDIAERKKAVKKRIMEINLALHQGFVAYDSEIKRLETEQKKKHLIKSISLVDAIAVALEAKRKLRPKSFKGYEYYTRVFTDWVVEKHSKRTYLTEFSREMAEQFLSDMVNVKHMMPKTHNNFKSCLSTMFNWLVAHEYCSYNPWSTIPKMNEGTGKNIAYPPDLQKAIIAFCEEKFPEVLPLIYFMYYTLMRPNEICHIQIKHLGVFSPNKIYLPKEYSKNNFERHIAIHPQLQQVLNSMNLHKFPPNYYLFGREGIGPSAEPYTPSSLSDRYTRRVLIPMKIAGLGYTMYSWKHTGVVMAKRAGMTDAAIILQAGWKDIKSYQSYLKSLALEENEDFLKMMPKL